MDHDDLKNSGDDLNSAAGGSGQDDDSGVSPELQELQTKVDELENRLQERDDQLLVYRTALQQGQRGSPSGGSSPTEDDPLTAIPDDDIIDGATLKKVVGTVVSRERAGFAASQVDTQMISRHSDYLEVVTKHLPNILRKSPDKARTINALMRTDPLAAAEYAYETGQKDPAYQRKAKPAEDVARLRENLNKPGSPSQVGGTKPGFGKRDAWDMSEEEFESRRDKAKRGEIRH